MNLDKIKGKYNVIDARNGGSKIRTDNHLEALWEANKFPGVREIINVCGEKEFYREDGRWKAR